MTNEIKLSRKSQEFLENLSIYLFSSRKNPDEIEEIVNELEVHLIEAEKKGKSIENIIGKSPKEYMEMISNEMLIDYRTWFKYICILILGSFAFSVFIDLWEGPLSYSILKIIGHIAITGLFLTAIFIGFKYISTRSRSLIVQGIVLASIVISNLLLFIGLIYLNRAIDTPTVHFGQTGSFIVGIIAALMVIGISVWAKTWILIVIMTLLILPDYLLGLTSLQEEMQNIISILMTYGGLALYILLTFKQEKKNEQLT